MKNIELITNKIHFISNQKVMLDYDLALLYEIESLVSQFVIPSKSKFGGSKPFAFTEQGIAMLSSILNSEKAIKINIAIMRTFVLLRNSILSLEEISKKAEDIENQLPDIYKILNFLMDKNQEKHYYKRPTKNWL